VANFDLYTMYEKAEYFSSKFIRNGFAGIVLTAFLIYNALFKVSDISPIVYFFPLIALLWLFLGYKLKNKLQQKSDADNNIFNDDKMPYRQIDFTFRLLIIAALVTGFKNWKFVNYIIIILTITYLIWIYLQIKLVFRFLNNR
jgi:hypothetical protein